MFRIALALGLLVPVTAFAQAPGDDPQQQPPQPQPPQGPPPPGYAYAPPPPMAYVPPPAGWLRRGFTFEANLGVGYVHVSDSNGDTADSQVTLAGLDIGVGGFLTKNAALTLRFSGVTFTDSDSDRLVVGFVGPSVQYWLSDNLWVRGGVGAAVISLVSNGNVTASQGNSQSAWGLDLGVGYSFATTSKHTFNVSVEANPGFFDDGTETSVSFLAGYQYL